VEIEEDRLTVAAKGAHPSRNAALTLLGGKGLEAVGVKSAEARVNPRRLEVVIDL
jgi:hypothetical protein